MGAIRCAMSNEGRESGQIGGWKACRRQTGVHKQVAVASPTSSGLYGINSYELRESPSSPVGFGVGLAGCDGPIGREDRGYARAAGSISGCGVGRVIPDTTEGIFASLGISRSIRFNLGRFGCLSRPTACSGRRRVCSALWVTGCPVGEIAGIPAGIRGVVAVAEAWLFCA